MDGDKTITGFKEVVEYITAKDKKTASLLGGNAADKEQVDGLLCFLSVG